MKQFTIYVPVIDALFTVVEESEKEAREFLFYSDALAMLKGSPDMQCVEIVDIQCSLRSISQLIYSENKFNILKKLKKII